MRLAPRMCVWEFIKKPGRQRIDLIPHKSGDRNVQPSPKCLESIARIVFVISV